MESIKSNYLYQKIKMNSEQQSGKWSRAILVDQDNTFVSDYIPLSKCLTYDNV